MDVRSRSTRTSTLILALAIAAVGLTAGDCGPSQGGTLAVQGLPGEVRTSQVLTLTVGDSTLPDGYCPSSVTYHWTWKGSAGFSLWSPTTVAWSDPKVRDSVNCRGRLSSTGPVTSIQVTVPADFRDGYLYVKMLSWQKPGPLGSSYVDSYYQDQYYPVRLAVAGVPVARLVAAAAPMSFRQGTTIDARGSTDSGGQPLQYSWDLDGNGTYGDDPGTSTPGVARITSSMLWGRNGPRSAAAATTEQLLTGVDRMQHCTPTGREFVSLEAAPELSGRLPVSAGALRLWDMKVAWRDVNPSPGVFDWSVLDERLYQAEVSGAAVLLVLGLTPQWAAADPNAGDPRWGAGSASPPRDSADWERYVAAVVDRYGSRIAAYEVWNEANLPTFWTGTPDQMASMTATAYRVIKSRQPNATVLTPSVTTRLRAPMKRFMTAFLTSMKAQNYPFDGFAIHTYPAGNLGPEQRVLDVTNWQSVVVATVGPTDPVLDRLIWDTEVNYGLAGPSPTPGTSYTDALGAQLLAQTYVDSQRLGIDATFWYMYTAAPFSLLGVQFWSGTPDTLSAWNEARSRFAAGTNRCAGRFPVSVKVTTADGRSATARSDFAYTSGITENGVGTTGSVSIVQPSYGTGQAIGLLMSFPRTADGQFQGSTACVDLFGSGAYTSPQYANTGISIYGVTIPGRSTPGLYRYSIAFWAPGANPSCGNTTTTGSGLVQVVTGFYSVGTGARAAAPKVYSAPARLRLGTGTTVVQGSTDASGTMTGTVIRGAYTMRTPARAGGVRRPAPLALFASGSYALRMIDMSVNGAPDGSAVYVGTFTALLRGRGGVLMCLAGQGTMEESTVSRTGGTGAAARLAFTAVDEPGSYSPSANADRPASTTSKAAITASLTRTKQGLPANCRSLVKYLR